MNDLIERMAIAAHEQVRRDLCPVDDPNHHWERTQAIVRQVWRSAMRAGLHEVIAYLVDEFPPRDTPESEGYLLAIHEIERATSDAEDVA